MNLSPSLLDARPGRSGRRAFLASAGMLAGAFLGRSLRAAPSGAARPVISVFSKQLQALPYRELAAVIADLGFDGIEAPVRPGGHFEPAQVSTELPRLVEALAARGLEITLLATAINEVSAAQHAPEILRTAARLGVKRFRMGAYRYDLRRPVWPQLEAIRDKLTALVRFCADLGIQPVYQNHSGAGALGAGVWDLYYLVKDLPVAECGIGFDSYFATLEGGLSWPTELALVRDHIAVAYVKDFQWISGKPVYCPLGRGQVGPEFAQALIARRFGGPWNLHVNYVDDTQPRLALRWSKAAATDLATLRTWLQTKP